MAEKTLLPQLKEIDRFYLLKGPVTWGEERNAEPGAYEAAQVAGVRSAHFKTTLPNFGTEPGRH